MSPCARLLAVLASLLLVPLVAADPGGAATSPTPATSVAAAAGPSWAQGKVDARHPFSDPVFYPLRQYMRMDCYKANPGAACRGRNYHKVWTMTLSTAANTAPGDNAVLAMGAGVFRFVRKGADCGTADVTSFGTTVEIDHGGGWISRYGHLSNRDLKRLRAKHGKLVAAGERIGTMGMTGARRCGAPYLNFHVERNGVLVQINTLTACLDNVAEQWPRDQFPSYDRWNQVPEDDGLKNRPNVHRSFFPRMKAGEAPATLKAANAPDSTCLPTTAPATPDRPARPGLGQPGTGRLKVVWRGQPARTAAAVRVTFLRRSDNSWQLAAARTLAPGTSTATFSGLRKNVKHRVTVSYHSAAGWSAYSPVAERVVR